MTLVLHDTLLRAKVAFVPSSPPDVSVYACGPTVYDELHVGNWSSFLFYDVLVRWLERSGHRVKYVSNVTDVDDKTIRGARAQGVSLAAFTKRYADAYFRGLDQLGVRRADAYPFATAYVDGMRDTIQALLDRGHAYVADDGIYFRVASFPTYGELANLSADSVRAGASGRVRADEYEKESVGDFALWKAWAPDDGDVFWEPRFTVGGETRALKGRPGWHIECSVMASALLPHPIDLHLGGEDLKFPHHQNEIAQSEGATGLRPFVRHWMHRRHLLVDGAKMAKSKKNFYTLEDLVAREGEGAVAAFRFLVVSTHYGTPIDFRFEGLRAAATTLRNLADARARFAKAAGGAAAEAGGVAADARAAFAAAMDDDLNASEAMAAVHGLVHEANRRAAAGTLAPGTAAAVVTALDEADAVLGLSLRPRRALTDEERALLDARLAARRAKDFRESDRLRDDLARRGVLVKDEKDGQAVTFS